MQPPRVILYHKQSTSARTRFLRLPHGGVCGPEPLPALAVLMDEDAASDPLAWHPATAVRQAELALGMPSGTLEVDGSLRARVDAADGPVEVFLARCTTIDPPFEAAEAIGGVFIDLTQARGMAPVELALLRRAYEVILG